MTTRLKEILFGLLGKEPEGIVVTFLTGEPALARRMAAEVRDLIPGRRHYTVGWDGENAGDLWLRLRREFRGNRIAMAPVLFTNELRYRALREAAFWLAPTKILAYNARLERHHLKLSTWIASLLFLRGVPVDRIYLRPWGGSPDAGPAPGPALLLKGRPVSAARRRVAVLSPYFPYPLSHGGAVRIFNLLREASQEFDIFLFAFTEDQDPADYQPVLDFCAQVTLVPKPRYREPRWASIEPPEVREYRSPEMRAALDCGIDPLQVEYTVLAEYRGSVLVEHDVTFDLFTQIHKCEGTLSSWWDLWRWRRFERRAVQRFSRVVAMSEKDAALLAAPNVSVIPNGVDLDRFRPEPEKPGRRLLFVGSFRHFPNVEAFRFFTEEILPLLDPDVELTVVAGPDPLLHWSAYTGTLAPPAGDHRVRLLGFVSDVRPLYAEANLIVVPTTVSAGTNLKVLEAMAMERAVVSTASGCAGLGLEHGRSIWIANSAASFAAGIATLLEDHILRAGLAREARRLAQESFGWKALGEKQSTLWKEAGNTDEQGLQTRRGSPSDLARIGEIQDAAPEAARWPPASYLDHHLLIAEVAGTVAGFLVWRQTAPGEAEILNVAVAPEFRRHGAATALWNVARESFDGEFFLEVRESNQPARRLYERLGFQTAGYRPSYYESPSESAVVMKFHSC